MPRRLSLLFVVLLAALSAASSAQALTIGIADQKPDMFSDPRFLAGDIQFARRAVAWDALTSPTQTAQIDAWMNAARAAHVNPLLSFTNSSTNRRELPTPERLLYEFRRFRARYPWVTDYATWNEANHCGQPTCHRPELVASYWRKLRRACPTCRILAAEVLDMPNMTSWVKAFRRKAKVEPRYWGIHNYIDANRLRTTGTRRLLKTVKGQVWFTETGGIVSRTNRRKVTFPESAEHAAKATRFLFDDLIPLSRRITRVYLYHWNSEPGPKTWDSALIGPTGKPRPAYRVLQRVLSERAAAKLGVTS
jgi:polysaccharide biosynthesis protein PslG